MSHERWMGHAIAAAMKARGTTSPNPSVGAVLVRDGQLLAEGFTHPVGGWHAERNAFAAARTAGIDVRGATLYVTLEPCCHWGRTPPCTDAVLESGVSTVVVGCQDPFHLVSGNGLAILRAAGLEVVVGVQQDACRALIRGFQRAHASGLPEVDVHAVLSSARELITQPDVAPFHGSDPDTRHGRLRNGYDALVFEVETVAAEDPEVPHRAIVLLDPDFSVAADARMFKRRTLLICAEDAPVREVPAAVRRVPRGPDGLSLDAALRAIVEAGYHRVLFEVGVRWQRALVAGGRADAFSVEIEGGADQPGPNREYQACTAHLEPYLRALDPVIEPMVGSRLRFERVSA